MHRIQITKDGPEFSRLAYGTWRLLATTPSAQEINRRLNVCLELGITTLDTAEIYGKYEVEKALGEALALSPGLRDKLEIVTRPASTCRANTIPSGAPRSTTRTGEAADEEP
jgi:predicted oxidoreductase